MNTKQIQLALIIFGLSSCLICAEDDEAKQMRQNPDWHITSEVFTNPPYWLIPTNVPFQLAPLNNGKWVWTTNKNAGWDGISINLSWNEVKRRQVNQQWIKEHRQIYDPSDPPGIANVVEYRHRTWDQKRIWNTNEAENWRGVWAEDTNTGWRINLRTLETTASKMAMQVLVGSIATDSGVGLLPSPDGKFAKLELLDANGKVVPAKKGAALALYGMGNRIFSDGQATNYHSPSLWDATVARNYPETISDMEYPRWNVDADIGFTSVIHKGMFTRSLGFVSNGPPCFITAIIFNDIFEIKAEGDYTLTVQPVLYRMQNDGGTFQGYLDRVDLPSVTTKVHFVPNDK